MGNARIMGMIGRAALVLPVAVGLVAFLWDLMRARDYRGIPMFERPDFGDRVVDAIQAGGLWAAMAIPVSVGLCLCLWFVLKGVSAGDAK